MDGDRIDSAWCTAATLMTRDCQKWQCRDCPDYKMPTKEEFEAVMLNPPEAKIVVGKVRKDNAGALKDVFLKHFDDGVTYVMEEMEPVRVCCVWAYDKFGEKSVWWRKWFEVDFE